MTKNYLTPEDIEAAIQNEQYYVFPGTTTTVCCLTIKYGFTVIGQSACVDPDNFNAEIGKEIAREDAVNKIWPLEGYALAIDLRRDYD
jgi:hypothetical protein